jgi:multicomponent Na+:H+ antiporter subunit D
MVITALAAMLSGVLAGMALSPLGWATLIVERNYLP